MHDLARVGSRLRHRPVVWVAGFEPASSSFQARWATTTRHPVVLGGWRDLPPLRPGPRPGASSPSASATVHASRIGLASPGYQPGALPLSYAWMSNQCPRLGSNQHLSLFRRAPSPEWLRGHDDGAWRPRRCASMKLSKNDPDTAVPFVGTAGFEPARRRSKLRGLPVSRCPRSCGRRLGARDSNPDERGQSAPSSPVRSAPSEPPENRTPLGRLRADCFAYKACDSLVAAGGN